LYKATNEKYYLNYLGENGDALGGTGWAMTEFGWDVKYAGVQTLVAMVINCYYKFKNYYIRICHKVAKYRILIIISIFGWVKMSGKTIGFESKQDNLKTCHVAFMTMVSR